MQFRSVSIGTTLLLAAGTALGAPCPDRDADLYADCTVSACDPGALPCGDCDDVDAAVHPGMTELCNHRDDDCVLGVDQTFPRAVSAERHADRYPGSGDLFGWSIASVGDVNGDGVSELAVGSPYDDHSAWDAGLITLYSGADRRVLWYSPSTTQLESLGFSIAGTGDMDGDAIPDLLAGCSLHDAVRILSGADGHEIARCIDPGGGSVGDTHGVASAGDLDGDGVPEVISGAATNNELSHHQGKVTIYRYDRAAGTCSIRLALWDPDGAIYDNLGSSVAGIGDVTGDGVPDVAAGEPGDDVAADSTGSVLIFSGASGTLVRRLTDPVAGYRDNLGVDLHGIEDLNGDGVPDIAASTERRGNWEGEVILFSGADGSVIRRLTDASTNLAERLGGAIDVVPDVDGDGLDDILAGARYAAVGGVAQCGRAVLFSSGTGAILGVLEPPVRVPSQLFGFAVAAAGDATGDGIPEFAVAAPYDGTSITNGGSFSVLSLASVCDADGVSPFEGDCDDTDSSVWRRPTEARDLRFTAGKTELSWTPPADAGTTAPISYDTLRSSSPAAFGAQTCFESGGLETSTTDLESPGTGSSFFYLVRADNACGDGELGRWGTLEHPREAAACP